MTQAVKTMQRILVAGAIAMALTLSSCHSTRKTARTQSQKPVPEAAARPHRKVDPGKAAPAELADALIAEARSWLGVPYAWGGKTRDGVDCSGFLVTVFHDAAGIDLPRTTHKQEEACRYVERDDIAVGDILFFSSGKSGGKVAHVGMYVGNDRMIHASSSRGVVEDDITLKYYRTHYRGAGRVPSIARANPPRKSKPRETVPPPAEGPVPVTPVDEAPAAVPANRATPVRVVAEITLDDLFNDSVPVPVRKETAAPAMQSVSRKPVQPADTASVRATPTQNVLRAFKKSSK